MNISPVDQTLKPKKDPTSSIVSKFTKKLIELRDNILIEQQEYFKLKPTGTPPARFYALPKIHKDGTPMRPIISYIQELHSMKYQNTLQIY